MTLHKTHNRSLSRVVVKEEQEKLEFTQPVTDERRDGYREMLRVHRHVTYSKHVPYLSREEHRHFAPVEAQLFPNAP